MDGVFPEYTPDSMTVTCYIAILYHYRCISPITTTYAIQNMQGVLLTHFYTVVCFLKSREAEFTQ